MGAAVIIADMLRVAQQDLKAALRLAYPSNRLALYLCEKATRILVQVVLASEGQPSDPCCPLGNLVDMISDTNPIKPHLRGIQTLFSLAATYAHTTPTGRIPPPPDTELMSSYLKKLEEALQEAAACFGLEPPLELTIAPDMCD